MPHERVELYEREYKNTNDFELVYTYLTWKFLDLKVRVLTISLNCYNLFLR